MGWNAVYIEPKREFTTRDRLIASGHEVLLPFERVTSRKKVRGLNKFVVNRLEQPLFARYLFVEAHDYAAVRSTRGVIDFVRTGGLPLVIHPRCLAILRAKMDAEGCINSAAVPSVAAQRKAWSAYEGKVGDSFEFKANSPLSGLIGRISSLQGMDETGELKAWIEIFGRESLVTVPVASVGPLVKIA